MARPSQLLLAFIAIQAAANIVSAASIPYGCATRNPNNTFFNPPLPYAYNALEPAIDNTTMGLHHGRHQQAYINNLNTALAAYPKLRDELSSLSELVKRIGLKSFDSRYGIAANFSTYIRNNAGGAWNHNQFFRLMTAPNTSNPATALSADFRAKIVARWGGIANMTSALTSAGSSVFGSGWAWLVYRDPAKYPGELDIITTPNQDNPLMLRWVTEARRGIPLLGVDVWEHAYYLTYRNVRASYLSAWLSVVDWARVQRNYELAVKGDIDSLYC